MKTGKKYVDSKDEPAGKVRRALPNSALSPIYKVLNLSIVGGN